MSSVTSCIDHLFLFVSNIHLGVDEVHVQGRKSLYVDCFEKITARGEGRV